MYIITSLYAQVYTLTLDLLCMIIYCVDTKKVTLYIFSYTAIIMYLKTTLCSSPNEYSPKHKFQSKLCFGCHCKSVIHVHHLCLHLKPLSQGLCPFLYMEMLHNIGCTSHAVVFEDFLLYI